MKKNLIVLSGFVLAFALVLTPVAFAQVTATGGNNACADSTPGTPNSSGGIISAICTIGNILNTIIPLLITLGVVYFIWGVVTYVIASDEEAKKSGRARIIYGIIGLAVIVAVWGLVKILTDTFGVNNDTTITLPIIQGTGGAGN